MSQKKVTKRDDLQKRLWKGKQAKDSTQHHLNFNLCNLKCFLLKKTSIHLKV